MRELAEQAEELMVKRVQELRDEFGMSRSKTYDLEVKEYVARMDRILHTLSEEDREWLDNQLVDKFCISETECRELYMVVQMHKNGCLGLIGFNENLW